MINKLSARFEPGDHKQRSQGGQTLTYVPTDKIIERLNATLGTAWSWSVHKCEINPADKYAIAHGTLTYHVDGVTYSKDGVGMGQNSSAKVELDMLLKTANSEALKNAAKLLGVGLYLYDEGERKEVEQDMRSPRRRATAAAAPVSPPPDAAEQARKSLFATVNVAARQIGITQTAAVECAKGLLKSEFGVSSTNDCNPEQLRAVADKIRANPRCLVPANLNIEAPFVAQPPKAFPGA